MRRKLSRFTLIFWFPPLGLRILKTPSLHDCILTPWNSSSTSPAPGCYRQPSRIRVLESADYDGQITWNFARGLCRHLTFRGNVRRATIVDSTWFVRGTNLAWQILSVLGAHWLISIYAKHRQSFSRQICSQGKPSGIDNKALGPEFARRDLLRTPRYPRDLHIRAIACFFRGCYPEG